MSAFDPSKPEPARKRSFADALEAGGTTVRERQKPPLRLENYEPGGLDGFKRPYVSTVDEALADEAARRLRRKGAPLLPSTKKRVQTDIALSQKFVSMGAAETQDARCQLYLQQVKMKG